MIPHGGMPYESLTGISGKIQFNDLAPGVGQSSPAILTSSPLGLIIAISGDNETLTNTRFRAGEHLSENDAVFVDTSGLLRRALASASGTMPCIGIVSVIPVSIALSGGVNVSGIFGSGISISSGSGSPVLVIIRGIKDSIFVGLSGVQNIATHGNITVANSGFNLIPVSGALPNIPLYVSDLSAGLIQVTRPATGFVQRISHSVHGSGAMMINPDAFYYSISSATVPGGLPV